MNENPVTFLSQYVIACFYPSRYRELIEDKKHSVKAYLAVLILFFTLITDVIPALAWEASVGGMENLFLNRLPAFTIEDGVMKCDQPLSFSLGNVCHVKEDTGVEAYTFSDVKEEAYAFYFSKTNMVMVTAGAAKEIPYTDFGDQKVDNNTLVSLLPIYRISMGVAMVVFYLITLIQYIAMAMFFALLCRGFVKDPSGDKLPFNTTLTIAVYARTLFVLIQSVGIALGLPVNNLIVELVLAFVTFSYMFRGQASVLKIDLKK